MGPLHEPLSSCDRWVVLDFEHAWSERFGKVIMNWPNNSLSENVHWEWECGKP